MSSVVCLSVCLSANFEQLWGRMVLGRSFTKIMSSIPTHLPLSLLMYPPSTASYKSPQNHCDVIWRTIIQINIQCKTSSTVEVNLTKTACHLIFILKKVHLISWPSFTLGDPIDLFLFLSLPSTKPYPNLKPNQILNLYPYPHNQTSTIHNILILNANSCMKHISTLQRYSTLMEQVRGY